MERTKKVASDAPDTLLEKLSAETTEIKNIRSVVRTTLHFVAGLGFAVCFTTLYQSCHEQDRETRFQIMALKARAAQDDMEEAKRDYLKLMKMQSERMDVQGKWVETLNRRSDELQEIVVTQHARLNSIQKALQNCECR